MDEQTTNLCHMAEYLIHRACESADPVAQTGFADTGARVIALAELTANPADYPRVRQIGLTLKDLLAKDVKERVASLSKRGPVDVLVQRLRRSNLGYLYEKS